MTVGKSALGYEARLGFCEAFIAPFDLRSRNRIFPAELFELVFMAEDLFEDEDFPRLDRLGCGACFSFKLCTESVSRLKTRQFCYHIYTGISNKIHCSILFQIIWKSLPRLKGIFELIDNAADESDGSIN